VSAAIALVAVVVSVFALRWAKRSADAAEGSAEAARISADVAQRDETRQLEEAAERAVTWEIEWLDYDTVRLRNCGRQAALDVNLTLSPSMSTTNVVVLPKVDEVLPTGTISVIPGPSDIPGGWVGISWRLTYDLDTPPRKIRLPLRETPSSIIS
jgi:hypothetical protein